MCVNIWGVYMHEYIYIKYYIYQVQIETPHALDCSGSTCIMRCVHVWIFTRFCACISCLQYRVQSKKSPIRYSRCSFQIYLFICLPPGSSWVLRCKWQVCTHLIITRASLPELYSLPAHRIRERALPDYATERARDARRQSVSAPAHAHVFKFVCL